jgi:hypothetical protein
MDEEEENAWEWCKNKFKWLASDDGRGRPKHVVQWWNFKSLTFEILELEVCYIKDGGEN